LPVPASPSGFSPRPIRVTILARDLKSSPFQRASLPCKERWSFPPECQFGSVPHQSRAGRRLPTMVESAARTGTRLHIRTCKRIPGNL
jgi:hypothetical protein